MSSNNNSGQKIEEIDLDTDESYTSTSTSVEEVNDEFKDEPLTQTIVIQRDFTEHLNDKLLENDYKTSLKKNKIMAFLKRALEGVSEGHQALDSSKVWISFWVLNGLDVLNELDTMGDVSHHAAEYLAKLQNATGGFGGGNSHTSHMVSTFAAVSAVYSVGTKEIYNIVNRETMYQFLMRMKTDEGAFRTEVEGEVDSRSTYCAIAVASMLNILTPELVQGVPEFLERCQTYEGGFGAYPGNEAHGGYTFCSVAALSILNSLNRIDMESLHRWITLRQVNDGGFQGRTNKLADTCYSYWQGAAMIIVQAFYKYKITDPSSDGKLLFNQRLLQEYIILCCQQKNGGLSDHPMKQGGDYYHTCYGMTGLSMSQHNDIPEIVHTVTTQHQEQSNPPVTLTSDIYRFNKTGEIVEPVHPVYNVRVDKCILGLKYFQGLNSLK